MKGSPYTFEEAVIEKMGEGHPLRQAFNLAREAHPGLYVADRAITQGFSENSWFALITAAKFLASRDKIPLGKAILRVYEENPVLLKALLGRDCP